MDHTHTYRKEPSRPASLALPVLGRKGGPERGSVQPQAIQLTQRGFTSSYVLQGPRDGLPMSLSIRNDTEDHTTAFTLCPLQAVSAVWGMNISFMARSRANQEKQSLPTQILHLLFA